MLQCVSVSSSISASHSLHWFSYFINSIPVITHKHTINNNSYPSAMCKFYQKLNLTLPSGPPKNGVKSRRVLDPGSEKYALYKNCGLPCHCTSAAIYSVNFRTLLRYKYNMEHTCKLQTTSPQEHHYGLTPTWNILTHFKLKTAKKRGWWCC